MISVNASDQIGKAALQILASAIGRVLGEQSKIYKFVELAAERPSSINMDRARRTFDALPVYQRKRIAETAEGVAQKQKSSMSMAAILNRLGNDRSDTQAKKIGREFAW